MIYKVHVSAPDDRWDLIAWRFYSDEFSWESLYYLNKKAANSQLVLPAGINVTVPVEDNKAIINNKSLPPWKR